jgi:hypothetical protein
MGRGAERRHDPGITKGAVMEPIGLTLKVWCRRDSLDERLARGADPRTDPALDLRARQLGSRAGRLRLAKALNDVLRDARASRLAPTARLAPRRTEVRACEHDLLALVRRLVEDRPIDVQGAAMASRLVFDGASPLYHAAAPVSLRHAIRSTRLALDHGVEPRADFATFPRFERYERPGGLAA